jgi:hypothetical protein
MMVAALVCRTRCLHRLIIHSHNKCGLVAAKQANSQPAAFKTRRFTERYAGASKFSCQQEMTRLPGPLGSISRSPWLFKLGWPQRDRCTYNLRGPHKASCQWRPRGHGSLDRLPPVGGSCATSTGRWLCLLAWACDLTARLDRFSCTRLQVSSCG